MSIRMENKDNLSGFECNVVVGARWADFSISETTNLLLFLHISMVYREFKKWMAVFWVKTPGNSKNTHYN